MSLMGTEGMQNVAARPELGGRRRSKLGGGLEPAVFTPIIVLKPEAAIRLECFLWDLLHSATDRVSNGLSSLGSPQTGSPGFSGSNLGSALHEGSVFSRQFSGSSSVYPPQSPADGAGAFLFARQLSNGSVASAMPSDTERIQQVMRSAMFTDISRLRHLVALCNRDIYDAVNLLELGMHKLTLPTDANKCVPRRQEAANDFQESRNAAIRSMSGLSEVEDQIRATRLRIVSSLYVYYGLNDDIQAAADEAQRAVQLLLQQSSMRGVIAECFGTSTDASNRAPAQLRLLIDQLDRWLQHYQFPLPTYHVSVGELFVDPRTIFQQEVHRISCISTLQGHSASVTALLSDAGRLYSASSDKSIKVWDTQSMICLGTLFGHTGAVVSLIVDGDYLFSASEDCSIGMWDLQTMSIAGTFLGHVDCVRSLAKNSGRLFSASFDKTIKAWDIQSMACIGTLEGHAGYVSSIAFGAGRLFSASFDKSLKAWDLHSMACVGTMFGHQDYVRSVVTDAGRIYSASFDRTIKSWDVNSMSCMGTFEGHCGSVVSLVIDTGRLYSGSEDNTVKIWDVHKVCCIGTLEGHTGWVKSLEFHSGRLYSGSFDQSIKVWDVQPLVFGELGDELAVLQT
eukprot:gnl/TRDRNA2_/TRDRNA2_125928_c0_seq1.p1 gnl/TRDRNA2_/TRDRNA2_125928_c0~~gnl/TRDRNA2_/TRDRNA2_125928_c0_seq1.p1  ORF type:complete len:623 (-),score=60.11 gnl/TRDRNA2_/TRDRNA2_125928_c0_seq1:60-1928(-)